MSHLKKTIAPLTVILAIIGFSFCLSSTGHADMMSPASPTSLTNPSNPASPISPLNPANPASPLNANNMTDDYAEDIHPSKDVKVVGEIVATGLIIILVGAIISIFV
ncbi:hypothetical protein B5F04_00060 [Limosilactobacillus reuteri]|uniref:hypothetical protein n=1 Tax=Limosilactobacillus reuteri TaxID=1598 RepID=UPI000B389AF0|nr:hypothetical protein [Limosilactobacillus reuteri]OUP90780.1 hypothetical protein B5F04_00060 [Limosilactobacillus reuteri]